MIRYENAGKQTDEMRKGKKWDGIAREVGIWKDVHSFPSNFAFSLSLPWIEVMVSQQAGSYFLLKREEGHEKGIAVNETVGSLGDVGVAVDCAGSEKRRIVRVKKGREVMKCMLNSFECEWRDERWWEDW
jgi:hypothetical protein